MSEGKRLEIIETPPLPLTIEGIAEGYRFLKFMGVTEEGWKVVTYPGPELLMRFQATRETRLAHGASELIGKDGKVVGTQTDITEYEEVK